LGRTALFARALWWRRGLAVAVLIVGIVTTAVAALGPLYARSAAESTLSDRLATTSTADTGLGFTAQADIGERGVVGRVAARVPAPGAIRGYPTRIEAISVGVTARVGQGQPSLTNLVWRDGSCAHLIVISGRCPTGPHEAIVDDNALHEQPDWALGQTVLTTYGQGGDRFGPSIDDITIVGSYRPKSTLDPFWFGRHYFDAHLSPVAVANQLNAMFVDQSELAIVPPDSIGAVQVDYPLDAALIRLSTRAALQRDVDGVVARYAQAAATTTPALRTNLDSVLAKSRADQHQVNIDTLLVVVELAILAWLALFGVVADAIGARGNDIALAKLRGHSPASILLFAVGEPLALLALALPFGLLLALGVVHALAGSVLVAGTPVVLTPAVGGALAAAFAGGAIAAFIAARSILTRPVLEQWRNTTSHLSRGRSAMVAVLFDLVLVVAAIGGIVLLRSTGDRNSPRSITLLAPGLLLFATALAAVRLIPPIIRSRLRRKLRSRRLALFLALRQLLRRPAGLRLAALLAVAVGLASFAIAGESVARANRTARAQTELGAAMVASVQFQSTHDPEDVVAALDPKGTWAMAAATWVPDGGSPAPTDSTVIGNVLAVDPARLAAVGSDVRGQLSMTAIAASVNVVDVRPARFTATMLRVRVNATSITGTAPLVGLRYSSNHRAPVSIRTTALQLGSHDYTAKVDCADGCEFAGITWERPTGASDEESADVVVSSVYASADASAGWREVSANLTAAAPWRTAVLGTDAVSSVQAGPSGLHVTMRSGGGSYALLAYSPGSVPIVVSPGGVSGSGATGAMLDYTFTQANFRIVTRVPVLPQVLAAGAVADLDYMRTQLPSFDAEASWAIWLGPHAPTDAVAALRRAGLIVEQVSTTHHRVIVLSRQAPALALILLLICAVAASILAVGGTAISIAASGRRRSFELAALRVVGVRPRTLRWSCIVEQLLLLGASLVIGLPAGVVIARLVMPVIPEFSDVTAVALRFTVSLTPVVVFAVSFAALLTLTAVVAGITLARAAVASRLRETQQ
jgi:putative ABC transport system permease protein